MFTPFTVKGCSLELLKPGEKGIITCCKIPHENQEITAGISITLKQKFPVIQIKVNNKIISIDKEIARTIYVRIVDS